MAVPKDMFAKRPASASVVAGAHGTSSFGRAGLLIAAGIAIGFGLARAAGSR